MITISSGLPVPAVGAHKLLLTIQFTELDHRHFLRPRIPREETGLDAKRSGHNRAPLYEWKLSQTIVMVFVEKDGS